jgi:hypothetical protein
MWMRTVTTCASICSMKTNCQSKLLRTTTHIPKTRNPLMMLCGGWCRDDPLGTVMVPLSHLSVQPTARWYPVGRLVPRLVWFCHGFGLCRLSPTARSRLFVRRSQNRETAQSEW